MGVGHRGQHFTGPKNAYFSWHSTFYFLFAHNHDFPKQRVNTGSITSHP